jgi:hypothetical protein
MRLFSSPLGVIYEIITNYRGVGLAFHQKAPYVLHRKMSVTVYRT